MITSNRSEPSQRKMKLLFVFLAVLGVSTAAVLPAGEALDRSTRSLSDDFADFWKLIDTEAILEIIRDYVANDSEVQAIVVWLQSSEFTEILSALTSNESVINFGEYLRECGVDVDSYITIVKNWWELFSSASTATSTRSTGGVAEMITKLKATLPLTDLRALFHEKLETSESFAAFVGHLTSDNAIAFFAEIRATEPYQNVIARLEAYGLDFETIRSLIKGFMGWD